MRGWIIVTKEFATYKGEEFLSEELNDSFDIDELEARLESELEEELSNLEFLKTEKEKIGNPDALGDVILREIWQQFGSQIGLDMTNETLIQKYDREHQGETYQEVGQRVMQDKRYKDANKAMKEKQKAGELIDGYTGKTLGLNDKANLDHSISRKRLYDDPRRKQANIKTEDLANMKENLVPTNEALNKSKGAKSNSEYTAKRAEREKELIKQNERANKKIEESNLSDLEKKKQIEKNNKSLQDKRAARDDLMKESERRAQKAINKEITKGVVKATAKKAAVDAAKQMAIEALFSLLKEVMNAFVRFLKNRVKSLETFIGEMKSAIKSFFNNLDKVIQTGVSSAVGTIVNAIFDPIVSTFNKLASLIKQGISAVVEAIRYLTNKENKDKPFSVKIAQVGKIFTVTVVSGGAIYLGEVIEKALLALPGMNFQIPMLGSIAKIVGMFLGSLVSGITGAIIINRIDKFIAKKQKADADIAIINKGNQFLNKQRQHLDVNVTIFERDKNETISRVTNRHHEASSIMTEAYGNVMEDFVKGFSDSMYIVADDESDVATKQSIKKTSDDLDAILDGLV